MMMKNVEKIVMGLVLSCVVPTGLAAQAVLFVSLSMPDNVLKAYLKQGKQYHVPIVIRGLYTEKQHQSENPYVGNFKDTTTRVKQLSEESKVGGVSINPLLFRAFSIQVVPALVVYSDSLDCIKQVNHTPYIPCRTDRFDVLYGNLPIPKMLSHVSHQSSSTERSDFSSTLLTQYRKEGESL